jgi:hypothetical protein
VPFLFPEISGNAILLPKAFNRMQPASMGCKGVRPPTKEERTPGRFKFPTQDLEPCKQSIVQNPTVLQAAVLSVRLHFSIAPVANSTLPAKLRLTTTTATIFVP